MSVALQRAVNVAALSVGHVALNPVLTGGLLWILTKGPERLRNQLVTRIAGLRDPVRYAQILKTLKWCLALALVGKLNKQLNQIALNAWRVKNDKSRWRWSQEIAVITGGCSGIGALTVKRLISKGIKVVILDISPLPANLQGYANIKYFTCDITDASAVYETAEKINSTIGAPTILINNAGILASHTILNTSDNYLKKIFDVNVLSNWYTVKAFLPSMLKHSKGHIVTIASTASYAGIGGMTDYNATKAAILAFHEGLNQELKHHYKAANIITTSIHPHWVRTPLLAPLEQELTQRGSEITEPQDVANAVMQRIESCSGGQVFLPSNIHTSSWLRSLPNWIQEAMRDGVSTTILNSAK